MCLALKISATISLNLGLLLGVDALSLPCPQIAATADVVLRTEFTVGEKEICDKTSGVEMKYYHVGSKCDCIPTLQTPISSLPQLSMLHFKCLLTQILRVSMRYSDRKSECSSMRGHGDHPDL